MTFAPPANSTSNQGVPPADAPLTDNPALYVKEKFRQKDGEPEAAAVTTSAAEKLQSQAAVLVDDVQQQVMKSIGLQQAAPADVYVLENTPSEVANVPEAPVALSASPVAVPAASAPLSPEPRPVADSEGGAVAASADLLSPQPAAVTASGPVGLEPSSADAPDRYVDDVQNGETTQLGAQAAAAKEALHRAAVSSVQFGDNDEDASYAAAPEVYEASEDWYDESFRPSGALDAEPFVVEDYWFWNPFERVRAMEDPFEPPTVWRMDYWAEPTLRGGAWPRFFERSGYLPRYYSDDEGSLRGAASYDEEPSFPTRRRYVPRYLQQASALLAAANATCGWAGHALVGQYTATLTSVSSALECQQQCQLYSDPAQISNCTETLVPSETLCVAVNYSNVDGRCALLGHVRAVVPANDVVALPVMCESQSTFSVESSVFSKFQNNATLWQCMTDQDITPVAALTTSKKQMSSWAAERFQWRNDLRPDVEIILKAYADLPALTVTSDVVAGVTVPATDSRASESRRRLSIAKMPRVTTDMVNITTNLFYQTANILIPPESSVMTLPLIYPRGVYDWRECALLCDLIKSKCAAWTFLYQPDTSDDEGGGGCYLGTSASYPTALNADGDYRSVAGLVYESLPTYLFGEQQSVTPGTAAPSGTVNHLTTVQNLHPECDSVQYNGMLFRTMTDGQAEVIASNLYSLGASTAESCAQACTGTSSCVAYQFVPTTISATSSFITAMLIDNSSCTLFSNLGASPVLHIADPLAGAGFISCGTRGTADQESIAQWMSISETRVPNTKMTAPINYVANRTRTSCTSTAPWAEGWSLKGTLLSSQANLVKQVESSQACDDYCQNVQDCEAWTYGQWKTCYLFESVETYVRDAECTSGQLRCVSTSTAKRLRRILEQKDTTTAAEKEVRHISDCSRARTHAYYAKGNVLVEHFGSDVSDEDACFRLCRITAGCNYISWIPADVLLEGQRTDNPRCVLMDDVVDSDLPLPFHGAVASEMICDASGRAESKTSVISGAESKKTLAWVALGGIGGVSLVISALVLYLRNHHRVPEDNLIVGGPEKSLSRLILGTSDSYHNQLSNRLSFQSDIMCDVDDKPQILPRPIVRFADDSSPPHASRARGDFSAADPGTCITMRTEENNRSPDPCIDELIHMDVSKFQSRPN